MIFFIHFSVFLLFLSLINNGVIMTHHKNVVDKICLSKSPVTLPVTDICDKFFPNDETTIT